jgi:hypothetical protein
MLPVCLCNVLPGELWDKFDQSEAKRKEGEEREGEERERERERVKNLCIVSCLVPPLLPL